MGFGRLVRPLAIAAVALYLATAVACNNGSATPQLTPTNMPPSTSATLEATVRATPTNKPEEATSTPTQHYNTSIATPIVAANPTPLPATATPPPATATSIPTPPPPTPTPTPPPTPTPVPNPAVKYATGLGLSQDVVSGLAGFGLDGILDSQEKAFVDAVAANPLEVQLAMVNSPYMHNNRLSLSDLVVAANVVQKYDTKLREAVWGMPDKSIQLPSGGSVNPSSTLELVLKKDAKAVKVMDYMQSRIFDNAEFWKAFNQDEFVEGKYSTGTVYRQTWMRWDAKKWPIENWQAMITMMQKSDPFNYNEDDLDKIMDELGVYPDRTQKDVNGNLIDTCVYCYGKTWDLLEVTGKGSTGNNGYTAYSNLVGSEGNIVREWLKLLMDLTWKDGENSLLRPLRQNTGAELKMFFYRDPVSNPIGFTSAYNFTNVTSMNAAVRNGTFVSSFTLAREITGANVRPVSEDQAVEAVKAWAQQSFRHVGEEDEKGAYAIISPSDITPPTWAVAEIRQVSSGMVEGFLVSLFRSLGIRSYTTRLPGGNHAAIVITGSGTQSLDGNKYLGP